MQTSGSCSFELERESMKHRDEYAFSAVTERRDLAGVPRVWVELSSTPNTSGRCFSYERVPMIRLRSIKVYGNF